jgi:hypothetical protein
VTRCCFLVCVLLCACPPVRSATADEGESGNAGEFIDAYEAAVRSISTFELQVEIKTRAFIVMEGKTSRSDPGSIRLRRAEQGEETFQTHGVTRQILSGEQFRVDTLPGADTNATSPFITVWDGAEAISYRSLKNRATIDFQCRTLPSPQGFVYQNLYRTIDGDFTYVELLRERDVVVAISEDCVQLKAAPKKGARYGNFGVELSLSPEKGFLPTEISLIPDYAGQPQSTYVISLDLVGKPGHGQVWAPSNARIVTYELNKEMEFFGEEIGETLISVDMKTAKINEPVAPSTFKVQFADGTEVLDRVRESSYVVGAESGEDYLDTLAIKGRLGMQRLAEKDPRAKTVYDVSGTSGNARLILGLASAFVLVAVIGWLVLKGRQRS